MKELAEILLLFLDSPDSIADILTYDNHKFIVDNEYYWIYSDLDYSRALDKERVSAINTLKVSLSHSGIVGIEDYVDFWKYAEDSVEDLDIGEVLNPTSYIGEFIDEYSTDDRVYYIFKE